MQSYLDSPSATNVFFMAILLMVIGLLVLTVLWILCGHTGLDEGVKRLFESSRQASQERQAKRLMRQKSSCQELIEQEQAINSLNEQSGQEELLTPRSVMAKVKDQEGHRKAFRVYDDEYDGLDEEDKKEFDKWKKGFMEMDSSEVVDNFGLSGYAMCDLEASSGVNKLPLKIVLPVTALQAWMLQFCILFYMGKRVVRIASEPPGAKDVPFTIIFAAIYLHFMNCINDLPFSIPIAKHLRDLHTKRMHFLIAMPTFMLDGLLIPATSLIIGALYLCTSATVSDVILNSCAVAFVGDIDNWILQLNIKVNKANGGLDESNKKCDNCKVYIPVSEQVVKLMAWWLCTIPVVPWAFSTGMAYAGLYVLHL
jgi:hypothetical protein